MKASLLGMISIQVAGMAFAQSSVSIFGLVDMTITRGTATGAGSANNMRMGAGGNHLGFRGKEDLGAGLSASFWLESQLYTDSGLAGRDVAAGNQHITAAQGSGLMFTRRSTVSLSGPWGEFRWGRDYTPSSHNVLLFDPLFNNGVGGSVLVWAGVGLNAGQDFALVPHGLEASGPMSRASNEISYFLPPDAGGFFGQVSYWLGENPRNGALNEKDGTGHGARLGYARGPFEVAAGYSMTRYRATPVRPAPGAPSGDLESWNLGGRWDTGPARLMALYGGDTRRSVARVRGSGYMLGVSVPLGMHELHATASQYRIDGGPGADPRVRLYVLGYVYKLSKRTSLYATAARAVNSHGARFALGGSTLGPGLGDARSTGFDFGIRHFF